jgi:hypothetical protein
MNNSMNYFVTNRRENMRNHSAAIDSSALLSRADRECSLSGGRSVQSLEEARSDVERIVMANPSTPAASCFSTERVNTKLLVIAIATLLTLGLGASGAYIENQEDRPFANLMSAGYLLLGAALIPGTYVLMYAIDSAYKQGLFNCCNTDLNNSSIFLGVTVQYENEKYVIRVEEKEIARRDSPTMLASPIKYQFAIKKPGDEFVTDTVQARVFTLDGTEDIESWDDLAEHYISQKNTDDIESGELNSADEDVILGQTKQDLLPSLIGLLPESDFTQSNACIIS